MTAKEWREKRQYDKRNFMDEITADLEAAEKRQAALVSALNKIAYEPIGEADASVVQIYDDIVKIARAALSSVKEAT